MRKFLTWTLVSLVALLVMGVVTLDLLASSTARERDAVIARTRSRGTATIPMSTATPPDGALPSVTHVNSRSGDYCIDQEACWVTLEEQLRLGPWNQERKLWERYHNVNNGARAIVLDRFETGDFGEGFLSMLDAYAEQNKEEAEEVRSLLLEYAPECEMLQAMKLPDYHHFEHLIMVELAVSLLRSDFKTAIEDLTAMTSLAYMAHGYKFPHRFEPHFARIFLEALNSNTVPEETWRQFLNALRAYRDRDFMIHYVRQYPHIPFGATVQEDSYLKRGARALIREAQQPALNRDAARFIPVLDKLATLSTVPYYEAKPALQKLIDDYDLTPHDRHSYASESGARASIVNLVQVVFPIQAAIQAQIDLISLATALESVRRGRGSYPESLDDTTELLGAAVPMNPVDGTPYRYVVTDKGFRLGFELDNPVALTVLGRKSPTLWVVSVNGTLEIGDGEEWR